MNTPDGLFGIGEFSRLTFLSVRMLRHYDEHAVLRPAHVDPWNGYRYYAADQLPRAAMIRRLRDVGFGVAALASLAGILDDPAAVAGALRAQRARLEEEVVAAHRRLGDLAELLHHLQEETVYETQRLTIPAHLAVTRRVTIPGYHAEGEAWAALMADIPPAEMPALTEEPPCCAVYPQEEYVEGPVEVELVQPVRRAIDVPGSELREMPAQDVLAVTHRGSYEHLADAFTALGEALDARGLTLAGPMLARYLVGPAQTREPAKYVTEVCAPVR